MKVAVIGASGYSGGELLRLLAAHPEFECHAAIAHTQAGELIASVHPQLTGTYRDSFKAFDPKLIDDSELIFLALPHGESGKLIGDHEKTFAGKKIIDLGADFRLTSQTSWTKYYSGTHWGKWQYGLPELAGARAKIASAERIANPGCYATAIALSLAPFAALGARVNLDDVVITAASGTTGAGRSAKINLIGSEVMNSISAYKVGGVHQHTPEIEEAIAELSHQKVALSFTPFLAPLPRGIISSVSVRVTESNTEELRELFSKTYLDEPFVKVLPSGQWPQTNSLIGSNAAHLQVAFDEHIGRAVVVAAIDNLGKGAAGQAIQNANLVSGFAETAGLSAMGTR